MRYLVNAILTPDGTRLESTHRHDYKTHYDSVSNQEYMVDGGHDYLRRNVNSVPAKELSIEFTEDTPHELIRRKFTWGTYGKDQDFSKEAKRVPLKDLSDAHIEAIITTQKRLDPEIMMFFVDEMDYRRYFDITMPESDYENL